LVDLIYQSIHNPQRPALNTENEGIRTAMELISFENLTPEERTKAKNKEAGRVTIAKLEHRQAIETAKEIAKKLLKRNLSNEEIAEDIGLSIEQIQNLHNEK